MIGRPSTMDAKDVKDYFQSLLSPTPNKVFPEKSKSFIQVFNNDKSGDCLYDDPSTLRLNKESANSPKIVQGLDIFQNETMKKSSAIIVSSNIFKNDQNLRISPLEKKPRVSFVNLTQMMGNFAKNALGDVNKSVRGPQINNEYLKSLDSAFNLLAISSSRNPFLSMFKQLVFFNIQIFIFLMTFLSVINIVLVTHFRLGQIKSNSYDILVLAEWGVGIFFGFEVFLDLLSVKGKFNKIKHIFAFSNLSNILMIIEIVTTTLFSSNFIRINKVFIIIYILRSFKLIKLQMIIQYTIKKFKQIVRHDKFQIDSKNDQTELKYFVYSCALDITIGIFIEATIFLAVNEALDYEGYLSSGGPANFNYIGAAYFSIVSLTSIGYGDISPSRWESRFYHLFVLFFNLSVLSNFLGKMTEKMYELSPYICNFYFKNHIVIIGDFPISFCKYFIKELYQCDLLTSTVYNEVNSDSFIASKMILVGKEDPPNDIKTWLEDFSNDCTEIKYLKSNVLENGWHKQTNLQFARHLFAFSMNPNDNQTQGFESDKQMAFNIQKVANNFPKLEITLVLSTEFSNQIKNDSLWSKVNVTSAQILNEYIMANSLENKGLNTWLTHLATLREKSAPMNGSSFNHLEEYAENMSQEIYPIS